MSLLTSSEVNRMALKSVEKRAHASFLEEKNFLNLATQIRAYEKSPHTPLIKTEEEKASPSSHSFKPIASLDIDLTRPPNNARLNLYLVLHYYPKESGVRETLVSLLRNLYGEFTFFKEIPDLEHKLVEWLFEHKEQTAFFKTPDELGSLQLEDPHLQRVFYTLLKGTTEIPSLLSYITFDKDIGKTDRCRTRKINLLFAPFPLVEALFSNTLLTSMVLSLRENYLQAILEQEQNRLHIPQEKGKNRSQFAKEFKAAFQELCNKNNLDFELYKKILDFTLGEKGTVFFLKHKTGGVSREPLALLHTSTGFDSD